ncbi:hypothetical protein SEPCBS119000_001317 [Sporothrix epigloea]|uniref:Uncharacterized protein n=1 Tax=Sporothrix epigloea TaxID=1892477 RepID=A0ABP0DA17_9PEZI
MGHFAPLPGSGRQRHTSRSSHHQNGHFSTGAPAVLEYSGDGDCNGSRKRSRPAGNGSCTQVGLNPPISVGMPSDARLYAEFNPVTNEYQYYREHNTGANGNGRFITEGGNASQDYYSRYGRVNGNGSGHLATTAQRADAAADAAAAAASAASEEYYVVSTSSAMASQVCEGGMQFHSFQRSPPTTLTNPASGVGLGKDGSKLYALPNDETEQNRDDMKHSMALLLMRDELFYSPVDAQLRSGGMVYDLGTGTGIWAIDVAEKYPRTVVRGIDLSPIQPPYVPPNLSFAIDDFEDEWPLPANAFDLIHMRFSLWAVDDRATLFRRIFHHLKPGGFVEFQELVPQMSCDDDTLPPAHVMPNALRDFAHYIGMGLRYSNRLAGGNLFGDNACDSRTMDKTMTQELSSAGFADVQIVRHKCPLGGWAKYPDMQRCGLLFREAMLEGLRGWSHRPLGTTAGGLGWTPTQIEMFLIDVRKAVMDPNVHAYFPLHVTYAQKPMM